MMLSNADLVFAQVLDSPGTALTPTTTKQTTNRLYLKDMVLILDSLVVLCVCKGLQFAGLYVHNYDTWACQPRP